MEQTPKLNLPYIMSSQAQKHVTHNEAIRMLDAVVQLSVLDNDHISPPETPLEGSRYIVAENAVDDWLGRDNQVAAWQDNGWAFHAPENGWLCWTEAANALFVFNGQEWREVFDSSEIVSSFGVNAAPDDINRLTVSSASALFNHDGAGHQLKLNKAASEDTASLLLQNDFTGRAELGLAGDNNLHFKVSPDGTAWKEAILIDSSTGFVSFPQTNLSGAENPNILINGDFMINQRGFPGGILAEGTYGFDRWKALGGPVDVSLNGYVVTLNGGALAQVVEPSMVGLESFAGLPLCISVENPSAELTVTAGSVSGTIAAGTGRQSTSFTIDAGAAGNLTIQIAKTTAGVVGFGRVKAEVAASSTIWAARMFPSELSLCQRYFQTSVPNGESPAAYTPGAGSGSIYAIASGSAGSVTVVRLPSPMRVIPTVAVPDGAANTNKISVYEPGPGWLNDYTFTGVLGLSDKGFSLQQNNVGVYNISFDYSAEAEL